MPLGKSAKTIRSIFDDELEAIICGKTALICGCRNCAICLEEVKVA